LSCVVLPHSRQCDKKCWATEATLIFDVATMIPDGLSHDRESQATGSPKFRRESRYENILHVTIWYRRTVVRKGDLRCGSGKSPQCYIDFWRLSLGSRHGGYSIVRKLNKYIGDGLRITMHIDWPLRNADGGSERR